MAVCPSMRAANMPSSSVRTSRPSRAQAVACNAHKPSASTLTRAAAAAALSMAATTLIAGSAHALSYSELQGLTYKQVKGSGVANTCPNITGSSSSFKDLQEGDYKLERFCMEPTSFTVKDEATSNLKDKGYVDTKLLTRLTYTLDGITADFKLGSDGQVQFKEEDGLDYAAVTVQLPGGERVPFLFSVKQLAAHGTLDSFSGDFDVPSYRGSTFMDPKGRGGSTGYDNAIALPAGGAADADELQKENNKMAVVRKGSAVFSVGKVDADTGEIAGVFQSIQPTDDDMGAKAPKDVKVTGLWYGQLNKA